MKKALLLLVLCGAPLFAQNPVEEAKTKITKQKHEAMVEHAKTLLERKESLEKELAEIDAKLAKLANGEDVRDESSPCGTGTITTVNCCSGAYISANSSGFVASCH